MIDNRGEILARATGCDVSEVYWSGDAWVIHEHEAHEAPGWELRECWLEIQWGDAQWSLVVDPHDEADVTEKAAMLRRAVDAAYTKEEG